MRGRVALAASALVACAGCILPARSFGAYEEKAAATAETVASAVQNANLAVSLADKRDAFTPYITTLLQESEDDASSAQSTFESIQPPDDASIELADALGTILDGAVDTLGELRVAARRGRFDELPGARPALADAATRLDAFLKAHG
jgi:hypothetical protein